MKNSIKFFAIICTAIIFVTANMAMAQKAGGPWTIPAKYKAMKSTVKAGDASINTVGKEAYNKHCKSCHGSKGLGDGSKSAQLKTEPGDFSVAAVQSLTDGTLFYKMSEGRDDMPSFKKKVPDEEDRWNLVNYMRTFKK